MNTSAIKSELELQSTHSTNNLDSVFPSIGEMEKHHFHLDCLFYLGVLLVIGDEFEDNDLVQ